MNKQRVIWVLAVANVALAATLAWRGLAPNEARAQAPRAEVGKYVMIPGNSPQLGVSVIYFLDTANRRIGAIAPDAKEVLMSMPTLALDPVFDAAANQAGPSVNPDAQRNPNSRAPRSGPGTR